MPEIKFEYASNWKPIWSVVGPLILIAMGFDVNFRTTPRLELQIMIIAAPILFTQIMGYHSKLIFEEAEMKYNTYFYWKKIKSRIIPYNEVEAVWVQRNPVFKSKIVGYGVVNGGKKFAITAGKFTEETDILNKLEEKTNKKRKEV